MSKTAPVPEVVLRPHSLKDSIQKVMEIQERRLEAMTPEERAAVKDRARKFDLHFDAVQAGGQCSVCTTAHEPDRQRLVAEHQDLVAWLRGEPEPTSK